jgi:hypothetical protein
MIIEALKEKGPTQMDEKWMESLGSPWHVGKSLCKVRLLLLRVFLSHFLFVAVNSCVAPFSLSLSLSLSLQFSLSLFPPRALDLCCILRVVAVAFFLV